MRRVRSRTVSWVVVAAVTAMLSPMSMAFATVNDDQVTSQKLKEADGTTLQNTNSGSGVKTGHIQNGAVTNDKLFGSISGDKLVNDAITTAKIADNAVTDAKILGSISGNKLAAGTVPNAAIADNAITDAKISGTISGSKLGAHGHNVSDLVGTVSPSNLPIGTTAGTVAAGDHSHDSSYQKKYANVVVVALSGGDFTDPATALASINDASATNTYLVKIMPGVYYLPSGFGSGSFGLMLRSFVDIEGSGRNATKLIQQLGRYALNASSIVGSEARNFTLEVTPHFAYPENSGIYAWNSEIQARDIQINLVNPAPSAAGIYIGGNSKAVLKDIKVTVLGDGATSFSGFNFQYGVSAAQLENLTVESLVSFNGFSGVSCGAVTGTVTVRNLKFVGVDLNNDNNYGASVGSSKVIFYDSDLVKVNIVNYGTMIAINSMIDSLGSSTGHFKGVNCYNQNFDPVSLNQ